MLRIGIILIGVRQILFPVVKTLLLLFVSPIKGGEMEIYMELEKRKEYLIFTIIFWLIGFVIFGGIASANKELLDIPWNTILIMLVYGLGGGLLLGGLVSGIILFSSFFKRQKLLFKIILCIFFPITFMLICLVGIFSFIPYEIFNFICIKKNRMVRED